MGIPRVVIGTRDPFSEVNGRGIEHLKAQGVEVIEGILEDECRFVNRRFFTFHEKKRPYIILKWAQTADGFMDKIREENERGSFPISSSESRQLVHQWRSLEQAILVGPTTALNDDPALTVRLVEGDNPIRIVIDEKGCLPEELQLFNKEARTIALVGKGVQARYSCEILPLEKSGVEEWIRVLHEANIQSILVEGGAGILNTFIESGMWDEMRVFTSNNKIERGLKAPKQIGTAYSEKNIGEDLLTVTVNK
jgi:diaminohydroxyphosphoribosylaminopyrimidine deaminase/5-amino-6-(5-phosphoribosylamino)uracil reductase